MTIVSFNFGPSSVTSLLSITINENISKTATRKGKRQLLRGQKKGNHAKNFDLKLMTLKSHILYIVFKPSERMTLSLIEFFLYQFQVLYESQRNNL